MLLRKSLMVCALLEPQGMARTAPPFLLLLDVVRQLTAEERAAFLRFCTGNEHIPAAGTVAGYHVAVLASSRVGLPTAHTCARMLVWPSADSPAQALR